MLLDSAFLIDLLDEDAGAVEKLDELEDEQTPIGIPTLVVVEVGVGLSVASEQQLFDDMVDSVPVFPSTARRRITRSTSSATSEQQGRKSARSTS